MATVTLAFRWPVLLAGAWDDTSVHLPSGSWRNALTGEGAISGGGRRLGELLTVAPVALLERA